MTETYDLDAMIAQLIPEEGEKAFVYDDATGRPLVKGSVLVGNPTVGIGRNLAVDGLTDVEARFLCSNDCLKFAAALDARIPWWRNMSPVRQRVILDLGFNMGVPALVEGWPRFLAAMQAGNWQDAAAELRSSDWWGQVGQRGPMIVQRILAG